MTVNFEKMAQDLAEIMEIVNQLKVSIDNIESHKAEKVLTTDQLAEMLGVERDAIYRKIKRGEIPVRYLKGSKRKYFLESEVIGSMLKV